MNQQDLINLSTSLNNNIISLETEKKILEDQINDCTNKIATLQTNIDNRDKTMTLLTEASKISREKARIHFEKIVTSALQFVTQSTDYEFVIQELNERSKASYEFFVKSKVNGQECLQKPQDANGGGFVDIIALAAKYAYLEIFDDPKIMSGTLIFDEPGKMISEEMSIKFAEYIKFLGTQYNRQTIMITHNDKLASIADESFFVSKNANGYSNVTNNTLTSNNISDLSDIEKEVEEIF